MRFVIYVDVVGEFRWSFVAKNNKKVADSGEGYQRRKDCLKAIALLRRSASRAKVIHPAGS